VRVLEVATFEVFGAFFEGGFELSALGLFCKHANLDRHTLGQFDGFVEHDLPVANMCAYRLHL
jgi:hypothetical protein